MTTELEPDPLCAEPLLIVNLLAHIGEGDVGAPAHQQLRGGHTAPRRADDGDAETTHGERLGLGHRSFKVVRLNSAKTMAVIRKRVMTFGSLQPVSSK